MDGSRKICESAKQDEKIPEIILGFLLLEGKLNESTFDQSYNYSCVLAFYIWSNIFDHRSYRILSLNLKKRKNSRLERSFERHLKSSFGLAIIGSSGEPAKPYGSLLGEFTPCVYGTPLTPFLRAIWKAAA
jgi:hypothetical protein